MIVGKPEYTAAPQPKETQTAGKDVPRMQDQSKAWKLKAESC